MTAIEMRAWESLNGILRLLLCYKLHKCKTPVFTDLHWQSQALNLTDTGKRVIKGKKFDSNFSGKQHFHYRIKRIFEKTTSYKLFLKKKKCMLIRLRELYPKYITVGKFRVASSCCLEQKTRCRIHRKFFIWITSA